MLHVGYHMRLLTGELSPGSAVRLIDCIKLQLVFSTALFNAKVSE
jgi:hypothetical protein